MEIEVMSGSHSTFSAGLSSMALAAGSLTTTDTVAKTAAWSGAAVAYGAAVAVAQDDAPSAPYTSATTDGFASGGSITSSHTNTLSVDYPYGPTPVSVDVSVTSASSYGVGDSLSGYGVTSPSLHGLF
jgi:hypothetical protein